jgi:(2Fe-2S) ferredoxin
MSKPEKHLFICINNRPPGHPRGSCMSEGADKVFEEFSRIFEERELFGRFKMTQAGCMGPCKSGPLVVVYPDAVWYGAVTPDDVDEIVSLHLLEGRPVERLVIPDEVFDS